MFTCVSVAVSGLKLIYFTPFIERLGTTHLFEGIFL